jgi:hypothetical protein
MQLRALFVPALALVLASACGPKAATTSPPPPDPTPAAPTCADAAASGSDLILAELGSAPTDDQRARLRAGIETSCVEDAWSPELVACVATMSKETSNSCDDLLTPQQNEGMMRRLGELMRELGEGVREKAYDDDASDDEAGGSGMRHEPTDGAAADPCEGGE